MRSTDEKKEGKRHRPKQRGLLVPCWGHPYWARHRHSTTHVEGGETGAVVAAKSLLACMSDVLRAGGRKYKKATDRRIVVVPHIQ